MLYGGTHGGHPAQALRRESWCAHALRRDSWWAPRSSSTEGVMVGTPLKQRIACPTQHSLRIRQGLDLAITRLLACLKELHKPIALSMQSRDVLHGGLELLEGREFGPLELGEFHLEVRFQALLIC